MSVDHNSSNHYVSMTDMMVGLLFVFVIMVAFFALKLSRQQLPGIEKIPKPVYQEVLDQRDALEKELRLLQLSEMEKVPKSVHQDILNQRDTLEKELRLLQLSEMEKVPKSVHQDVLNQRDTLEKELRLLQLSEVEKVPKSVHQDVLNQRDTLEKELRLLQLSEMEKISKPVYQNVVNQRDVLEKELRLLRLKSVSRFNEESNRQRKALIERVQQRLDDQGVRVAVDLDRGVLRLLGVDLFQSASTHLRNPEVVRKLSAALALESRCFVLIDAEPVRGAGCRDRIGLIESIFVEGHTDSVPMRRIQREDRIENNLQLSARRASNTFEVMQDSSPDLASFQNSEGQTVLSVAAYGEQRPVASNFKPGGREKNRRIDIRISMLQPRDEAEVEQLRALISQRDSDAP